jgi:hypothetical protein
MLPTHKPNTRLPSEQTPPQHLTEPEVHDPNRELPGWPGFRTQPGHSGLDPVESYSELGHVLGICLRDLLLFRVRSQSPLAWFGMAVVGFLFLAPLGISILYLSSLGEAGLPLLIFTFFPAILGILLWTNLALDIAENIRRKGTSHAPH